MLICTIQRNIYINIPYSSNENGSDSGENVEDNAEEKDAIQMIIG